MQTNCISSTRGLVRDAEPWALPWTSQVRICIVTRYVYTRQLGKLCLRSVAGFRDEAFGGVLLVSWAQQSDRQQSSQHSWGMATPDRRHR